MMNKSYMVIALVTITSSLCAMELTMMQQVSELSEAEKSQAWLVELLQLKINHNDSRNFRRLLGLIAHDEKRPSIVTRLHESSAQQVNECEASFNKNCLASQGTSAAAASIAGAGLVAVALPFINAVSPDLYLPVSLVGAAAIVCGSALAGHRSIKIDERTTALRHQTQIQRYLLDVAGAQELASDANVNLATDDNV